MRVLVYANRYNGRCRFPVDLGVEDVGHLSDDAVGVGEVSFGRKSVDCREFREVHLGGSFEGEVLEPVVPALEIGLSLEPKREQAGKVLFPVLPALLPRHLPDRVRLAVSNGDVAVAALLYVPDHFLHHHEVAEVRMAARHEPGENVEWRVVTDCLHDGAVIPVPDHDPPPYEIGGFGEIDDHRGDGLDAKFRKGLLDIERRGA